MNPQRYRIPDISVWRDEMPEAPVAAVIPEDRLARMLSKIQEYLSIGVEYVWGTDPEEQTALCDVLRNRPFDLQ